jgi:phage replication O-like protein O
VIGLADIQLEYGFTKIANQLLDALALNPLNGTQWRILIVVFRYTYGFNRKETDLSEGYISKATGIDRRNIRREMQGLIKLNILKVVREASFTTSRIISFNKDYEQWVRVNLPPEGKKDTEGKKEPSPGGELAPSPGGELTPQEIKTKERLNKEEHAKFFEAIWKLYPNKKGKGQISGTQKAKLYGIGAEELKRCIERYTKSKPDWQQYQNGSTFFNSGYVDYLDKNFIDADSKQVTTDYCDLSNYIPEE